MDTVADENNGFNIARWHNLGRALKNCGERSRLPVGRQTGKLFDAVDRLRAFGKREPVQVEVILKCRCPTLGLAPTLVESGNPGSIVGDAHGPRAVEKQDQGGAFFEIAVITENRTEEEQDDEQNSHDA